MSAAALRYAARRTVGVRALQRTRAAAVEGEEGRRLIHGGKPLSSPRVSHIPASRTGSTIQKVSFFTLNLVTTQNENMVTSFPGPHIIMIKP